MGNILTAKAIEYKGKRKRNRPSVRSDLFFPGALVAQFIFLRRVAAAGGPSVPVIWSHEGDWLVMTFFFFFLSLFPEVLCPVITTSSSLDCPLQALLLGGN